MSHAQSSNQAAQYNYRALFAHAADAIVIFDTRGYILETNACLESLVGFTAEEMAQMHFSSFCPIDSLNAAVEFFERVVDGTPGRATLPVLRSNGEVATTEVAASRVELGSHAVVQAILRDVTPKEQLAAELEAARDQLAHAQKMELVGQLAGGVAHDFNNLLSVIMGFAEFIDMRLHADSPLRKDVDKILQATESAASLVHRLLTFARREVASSSVLEPGPLLDRVRPLLERTLPSEISLVAEIDAELAPIHIAPVELEQIIMNLGINARDAMPDGGTLTIEAHNCGPHAPPCPADIPDDTPYICICVRDTGVGMDERTRERIFEPFFTTKGKNKGTGLGLATVRHLVEENGGVIRLETTPGQGSSFELYFPVAGADQADQTRTTVDPNLTPDIGGETILVVDDQAPVRELVGRILSQAGYTILTADSAETALEIAATHDGPIDLLLSDIVLPGLDGPSLAQKLREEYPELALLYTSGFVKDAQMRQTLRDQRAWFVAKPFSPSTLLLKVLQVLVTRSS